MGKSFPSEQGRGAPAAESWKGCNLWGGGPLVGHPVQAPSPLQKPLRPPLRRGGGCDNAHVPRLNSPRARRAPLGGPGAVWGAEPQNQAGLAGRPSRGPGASGRLAARPHVAGPQGGAGGPGARGEGLHLREVPGWSQPPSAERFSCPAARPAPQTREKFPRKNAWRAAGPWSRPESLRGKGRAAAASGATRCRGLQGVIVGTPAATGTPGGH